MGKDVDWEVSGEASGGVRETGHESAADHETARASESLLIELLPELRAGGEARLWCTSPGRGQLAAELSRATPTRRVVCTFIDLFQAEAATAAALQPDGTLPPNLRIDCAADLPAGPFDAALIPLRAGADSELAWEVMQHAYVQLIEGGQLFASSDEPRDHWVAGRMEALFGQRFTRKRGRDAIAYVGIKRGPLKKIKTFDCEFAFRDADRLVRAVSRPGVFSHRRLDLGARALLEGLTVIEENGLERCAVSNGMRVLDFGCGAGTVGIAAALRDKDVHVHFVDSMPRAIACAERGAALNGLTSISVQSCSDGLIDRPATFNLALGNPPYYSHHRISEIFVAAAVRALKPGGRAHFVTKDAEWFAKRMPIDFEDVGVRQLRTYAVIDGTKRR